MIFRLFGIALLVTFSQYSFAEFGGGYPPGGIPTGPGGGFGGGSGFGGPGGGDSGSSGAALAQVACDADWEKEKKRLRAEFDASNPSSSGFGGTARVFNTGDEGDGGSGSSLTGGSTTAPTTSGGQVLDLSSLGLDDLQGSLDSNGQGFRGMNGTGTNPTAGTMPNGQNAANYMAVLAGFEAAGQETARREREFEEWVAPKKWPFITSCIREIHLAAGVEPQGQSQGGGLNPALLQLLLSDGGGEGDFDPNSFYSDLPDTNADPNGDSPPGM